MCKYTIEQAVKDLDFVKDAEWGIQSKILDVSFKDLENYNLEILNKAITDSGYETMNTTADQSAYDNSLDVVNMTGTWKYIHQPNKFIYLLYNLYYVK